MGVSEIRVDQLIHSLSKLCHLMMLWSSYQSVQDPPALVIGAVVREEGPVDHNQAVEEIGRASCRERV